MSALISLLGVFFLSLYQFLGLLNHPIENQLPHFYLWLIILAIFSLLIIRLPRLIKSKPALKKTSWRYLALILLLAALLRLPGLSIAPANIGGDELSQALIARDFFQGNRQDLFAANEWYGSPNFYHFLTSPGFLLPLDQVSAGRLPSAVFGLLTIAALYLLLHLVGGTRLAVIGSLLLTLNHFHLNFSRLGSTQISDGFWWLLTGILLYLSLKRDWRWFGVLGLTLALSQNFYFGARILPLLIIPIVVLHYLFAHPKLKNLLCSLALLLFGFWMGFYPFLAYYVNDSSYLNRINQVSAVALDSQNPPASNLSWESLATNSKNLFTLFTTGATTGWYTPKYYLNPILALFFLMGLIISLRKIRHLVPGFSLITLLVTLFIVGFLVDTPFMAQRMVITTTALIVITALGLNSIYQIINTRLNRRLALIAIAIIIFMAGSYDLYHYFIKHLPDRGYGGENTLVATELSQQLKAYPPETKINFYGWPRMGYYGFSHMAFFVPELTGQDVGQAVEDNPEIFDPPSLFVSLPETASELYAVLGEKGYDSFTIETTIFKPPQTLSDRLSSLTTGNIYRFKIETSPDQAPPPSGWEGERVLYYLVDLTGRL
jgi:4-amino-4-deoxy-L-arabinose transferase-like glycosyltransferase